MDYIKDEYTTKEAANLLGLSEFNLRKKIRNKEINVVGKKGKTYIISKKELERYSEEKRKSDILSGKALGSIVGGTIGPIAAMASIPFLGGLLAPLGIASLFATKYKESFGDIDFDKKDVKFYKEYYKGVQKDLKIAQLELERLMLDKNDTVEYKKKELDLRMKVEHIEQNLQAIKMKIDSMSSQDEKKENVE